MKHFDRFQAKGKADVCFVARKQTDTKHDAMLLTGLNVQSHVMHTDQPHKSCVWQLKCLKQCRRPTLITTALCLPASKVVTLLAGRQTVVLWDLDNIVPVQPKASLATAMQELAAVLTSLGSQDPLITCYANSQTWRMLGECVG